MSLPSSSLSGPLPPSSPPETHNETLGQPARRKRSHDDMSNNPSTKSEPRPQSSSSAKDDGSQTPTPGSPTQALTPRRSTTTQRIIPPRENDESKDSHEGTEGAEDTEELDPAAEIEHFDWVKLEERYHRAIGERSKEEQDILQEWENLMNVLCSHTNSEARMTINKLLS